VVNRGLSYAEDLYENGNIVYALQEYAKVLCDIYTPKGADNPHKPYARYRMGVCAYRLGEPDAAARQWRRVIEDYRDSAAADDARRALAAVSFTDPFSSEGGRPAPGLPSELPSGLVKRFHLAAQLVDCELPLVAIKEYLKVIHVLTAGEPNPFQAEAAYRLGLCQHLRGRPDLAAAAWNTTIAQHPDTQWAEKSRTAITQAAQREAVLAGGRAEAER
jgi:tetratricopeptide (TPR) repeat protein